MRISDWSSDVCSSDLQLCIDLMREMLQLPDTHRIGIVPGSDTGAFEMAMWTMLGQRPVTTLAWESFGEGWVTDAAKQLKLDPTVIRADYGQLDRQSVVEGTRVSVRVYPVGGRTIKTKKDVVHVGL